MVSEVRLFYKLLSAHSLLFCPTTKKISWTPKEVTKIPTKPKGKKTGKQAPRAGGGALSQAQNSTDNPRAGLFKLNFATLNLFPPTFKRTLRYAVANNNILSTGTAGVVGTVKQYRLNSCYDFESTDAGHQPYGFDQMTALYQSYKVVRTKVDVLFTIPGATADLLCVIHFFPAATPNVQGLTPEQALEKPGTQCVLLSSSGGRRAAYTAILPIHQILGLTKKQFDADFINLGAAYNANPVTVAYMEVGVCSLNATASEGCAFALCVEQEVLFYNRVEQGSS